MSKVKTILGAVCVVLVAATMVMAQPGNTKDYKWDVGEDIPDNSPTGLANTQVVPDDLEGLNTIGDVNVDLHIDHTWQGDLVVDLTHNGVTVPLLYRAGASDGNGAGFSNDNFGTDDVKFVLDDEAEQAYDDVWSPGVAGQNDVGGSWIPFGMFPGGPLGGLSAFDGMDKRGEWTLFITDNASGDVGVLQNWSLHIENVPEPAMGLLGLLGIAGLFMTRRR